MALAPIDGSLALVGNWRSHDGEAEFPPSPEASVRRQVARDLHDTVVQSLQLMLVEMEEFKRQPASHPSEVVARLSSYQAHTRSVLSELRSLLYQLRDDSMMDGGYADDLRLLVRNFQFRTGIRSRISISKRWPDQVRSAAGDHVRRIVEEGLHNIRRHSGANACRVVLGDENRQILRLMVKDNGIGLVGRWRENRLGMGLIGIRERVLLLGGELSLVAPSEGGTILRASFPRESLL
jgi:signal transduction histidine kinase